MKVKSILLGTATVLILAGLLLGVGCKSSSNSNANASKTAQSPSAEDYFKKLGAITEDVKAMETAAQPSETAIANLSPDQFKQTGTDFLNTVITILAGATAQVKDLQPPQDLQGEHDTLVKELDKLVTTLRNFADEAKSVPASGIKDFFQTKVFTQSTSASFDAACSALQTAAGSKNIDVNLNCRGQQPGTPAQPATAAPGSTAVP